MQNDKSKFKNEFAARLITFTVNVLRLCSQLRVERNLIPIADQLVRSASSIGANVTEAKGASSKRDYIRFFEIALKSANETRYWLLVIQAYDKKREAPAQIFLAEVDEICRILGSSILTMKGRK